MSQYYSTATLLNTIKRRGMIPTNQNTFEDTDLLAVADEVIQIELVPLLLRNREEFFLTYADQTIVADTAAYRIPLYAIGQALHDVCYVTSDGKITPLTQISSSSDLGQTSPESPYNYYLKWNHVILSPTPQAGGTLRMFYYRQLGDLVETAYAGQITAIDTATKTVTIGTIPSTWVTSDVLDIIRGQGGHDYVATSQTSTNISGSDVTFASLPSDLAVGDWLAVEGQSPVPQVPKEMQPVLAQNVVAVVLEALGDFAGAEKAQTRAQRLLENTTNLISPRVREGKKYIKPVSYF